MRAVTGIYDDDDQLLLFASLTANNAMMGALAYLGIITGLRVGDMLALRAGDVGELFTVKESKTGKTKIIHLPFEGWKFIETYILVNEIPPDGRLFPTTRQTAHRYFKRAAKELGLENVGTHSMRKTYAWNVFRVTNCLKTTRDALNHKYLTTTMLYLVGGFIWMISHAYGASLSKEVWPCYTIAKNMSDDCPKDAPSA